MYEKINVQNFTEGYKRICEEIKRYIMMTTLNVVKGSTACKLIYKVSTILIKFLKLLFIESYY